MELTDSQGRPSYSKVWANVNVKKFKDRGWRRHFGLVCSLYPFTRGDFGMLFRGWRGDVLVWCAVYAHPLDRSGACS